MEFPDVILSDRSREINIWNSASIDHKLIIWLPVDPWSPRYVHHDLRRTHGASLIRPILPILRLSASIICFQNCSTPVPCKMLASKSIRITTCTLVLRDLTFMQFSVMVHFCCCWSFANPQGWVLYVRDALNRWRAPRDLALNGF